jgi:predicted trehalose synthase
MTAVDPKALGAHKENGHVVVRAYRPSADRVVAHVEHGNDIELKAAGDGLFEGIVEDASIPLRYELDNRPDWASIPVAGICRLLELDSEEVV